MRLILAGAARGFSAAALALAALALAALALWASSASAEQVRLPVEELGSAEQPSFEDAQGLAVYNSGPNAGDVLVADAGANTISRWHSDGTPSPFAALGTNVIDGREGTDETPVKGLTIGAAKNDTQLAIDESGGVAGGDIYLTQPEPQRVYVFSGVGQYLGQLKQAGSLPLAYVCGVGVGPAGALYVADPNYGRVYEYLPSANPPKDSDYKSPFFEIGFDPKKGTSQPCNVAAGAGPTAGSLFVSAKSGEHAGVTKWDVATREEQYAVVPGEFDEFFEDFRSPPFTLALDPTSGHLFVAGEGGLVGEYDAAGPSEASPVSLAKHTGAYGIAVDGAADRLYASRGAKGFVEAYGPVVTVPTVTTGAATGVGASGAILNGAVDPDGVGVTRCFFEYLGVEKYKENAKERPSESNFAGAEEAECEDPGGAEIGSGSGFVPVHANIGGLAPETEYVYRLAAANENDEAEPNLAENGDTVGASGHEKGIVFATTSADLKAETKPASAIGGTRATVNGVAYPGGGELSECFFEYGLTTAYGSEAPCEPEASEIPADTSAHAVKAKVTGLAPDTAYHFRLVIENAGDEASGQDLGFKTLNTVVTKAPTEVSAEALTLNGSVNPEGEAIAECLFEYGPTAAYGSEAECDPEAAEIAGNAPVAVKARLEGLQPGATVHYRLSATYEGRPATKGKDETAKTPGPPQVLAQWAADVLFGEATLRAEVSPEGLPTTFRVEYGPTAAYGKSTPELPAGKDSTAQLLTRFLEGLAPGTTYHYRFVASNEAGKAEGEDRAFVTYAHRPAEAGCPNPAYRTGPGAALPDCRAYELVSPLDKNSGAVGPGASFDGAYLGQGSPGGDGLAFTANTAFADAHYASDFNHYLARRGVGGWASEAIDPPLQTPGIGEPVFGAKNELLGLSPDLGSVWFLTEDNESAPPLSAGAQPGYGNLQRRENAAGSYEALTIAAPRNEVTRRLGGGRYLVEPVTGFAGASADLSDQLFLSEGAFTEDAPLDQNTKLYDLSGGALHLVSVLPDGSPYTGEASVGTKIIPSIYGLRSNGYVHATLSTEGSRAFWVAGGDPGTVYVRLNPAAPEGSAKDGEGDCIPEAGRACTVQLSPGGKSRFLTASPDGSKALLMDDRAADRALSLVDVASGAATTIAGRLSGESGGALFGRPFGFLGAAADLSRIYFASAEDLDGEGPAQEGARNLYAYHEGAYSFIAALAAADVAPGGEGKLPTPVSLAADAHDARVSPDGRHAAFVSASPALAEEVAGYDNTERAGGKAARSVYLYDATSETLACVSCNPAGAAPRATVQEPVSVPSGVREPETRPAAATLPIEPSAYYTSRPLSADGSRLFFNVYDALLPADTNGTWDVYEWEAPGEGGCDESDADYFPRNGGCVYLISTGQSPEASEFFDADPSGDNVFIRTSQGIEPRDADGAFDVYDARAGGGFPPPAEPAACEGEACRSVPPAPIYLTPASQLFGGPGNLAPAKRKARPCPQGRRKVRRKGRARCVKRGRRKQRRHAHERHHRGRGR